MPTTKSTHLLHAGVGIFILLATVSMSLSVSAKEQVAGVHAALCRVEATLEAVVSRLDRMQDTMDTHVYPGG